MTKKITPIHELAGLAGAKILPGVTPELERAAAQYSVAITPAMISLIDRNDLPGPHMYAYGEPL